MAGIVDEISRHLRGAALTPKHFETPEAHIVVSDEARQLVVLVRDDDRFGGELELEGNVTQGEKSIRALQVKEGNRVELGELGAFRSFVVAGLEDIPAKVAPGKRVEVAVRSAAAEGSRCRR